MLMRNGRDALREFVYLFVFCIAYFSWIRRSAITAQETGSHAFVDHSSQNGGLYMAIDDRQNPFRICRVNKPFFVMIVPIHALVV